MFLCKLKNPAHCKYRCNIQEHNMCTFKSSPGCDCDLKCDYDFIDKPLKNKKPISICGIYANTFAKCDYRVGFSICSRNDKCEYKQKKYFKEFE